MKLVSATDYILEKQIKLDSGFINVTEFTDSVVSYVEFLKQPLKLGMFIPCDENDEVLKEPFDTGMWSKWKDIERSEYCDRYEEAKERVLFKGWEYTIDNFLLRKLCNGENLQICLMDYMFNQEGSLGSGMGSIGKTIESLSMCGLDIELTETAIEQFI